MADFTAAMERAQKEPTYDWFRGEACARILIEYKPFQRE